MGAEGIPENVRQLIFEAIDSVEQLEALLLLYRNKERSFSAKSVSDEMRTTPGSAQLRLAGLAGRGVISFQDGEYRFVDQGALDEVVRHLGEEYRVRPYKIFELIFSPMKKARGFAEAFVVTRKKDEDPNG